MKKILRSLSVLSARKSKSPENSGHNNNNNEPIPHLPDPPTDDRWSEVVPPTSGLAFGAIWDPDSGIISFSCAELFKDSDDQPDCDTAADLPSDVNDNRSQILTINPSIHLQPDTTATLAAFQDAHPQYFRQRTPEIVRRRIPGSTLPSSTFGGFDVYFHKSRHSRRASNSNRHYSCFDMLDEELQFDPKTAFAEWENFILECQRDEGLERNRVSATDESAVMVELVLNSSFSTTTTSTSNYIEISGADDDIDPSTWSTLEAPKSSQALDYSSTWPHRRLRKRRPAPPSASPSEVLAREKYNHVIEPYEVLAREKYNHVIEPSSPSTQDDGGLTKLVRGLGRWKKSPPNADGWVLLEVMPMIAQRDV